MKIRKRQKLKHYLAKSSKVHALSQLKKWYLKKNCFMENLSSGILIIKSDQPTIGLFTPIKGPELFSACKVWLGSSSVGLTYEQLKLMIIGNFYALHDMHSFSQAFGEELIEKYHPSLHIVNFPSTKYVVTADLSTRILSFEFEGSKAKKEVTFGLIRARQRICA